MHKFLIIKARLFSCLLEKVYGMREINIDAQRFDKIRESSNFNIDKTSFICE